MCGTLHHLSRARARVHCIYVLYASVFFCLVFAFFITVLLSLLKQYQRAIQNFFFCLLRLWKKKKTPTNLNKRFAECVTQSDGTQIKTIFTRKLFVVVFLCERERFCVCESTSSIVLCVSLNSLAAPLHHHRHHYYCYYTSR